MYKPIKLILNVLDKLPHIFKVIIFNTMITK